MGEFPRTESRLSLRFSTMTNTREGYIEASGGKVWYREVGMDQKGIPLLILHGGPGAPHDYLEPLEALGDERPVIFYDQLGCGNSDRPDDPALWTINRHVEELEQVRHSLGLNRINILGQSWGSMLATDYLLNKKFSGVQSLIFSGPCLSASRWQADQQAYLAEMPESIRTIINEKEASGDTDSPDYQEAVTCYYRRHVCRLDHWPDCLNRTLEKFGKSVYENMWGPSEFKVSGTLRNYERAERLKDITQPILFTCGRYDEATPKTTAYYHWMQMHPRSELVIFENASHEHHLEKPEQYLGVIRDFLRKQEL
jgi:proline iminopeptidase